MIWIFKVETHLICSEHSVTFIIPTTKLFLARQHSNWERIFITPQVAKSKFLMIFQFLIKSLFLPQISNYDDYDDGAFNTALSLLQDCTKRMQRKVMDTNTTTYTDQK
jgi:hypothetical protein